MIRIKKIWSVLTLGVLAGVLAASAAITSQAADTQSADTAQETGTEAAESLTEQGSTGDVLTIDWNTFIIDNPEEYVTLGEYKGLDVEKTVYTITDEDVQIEVDNRLYAAATLEDTDHPAQIGDTVTADITSTVDKETTVDEDYPVDLGYETFGAEFDAQLEGCSPGDTLSFSLSFDEDSDVEEWAGQTVDFKVSVKAVQTFNQPELDDAWVKENSEYEDTESYLEALKKELQAESDMQNEDAAAAAAFQAAQDQAEFKGYPQTLYDAVYAQVYAQFEMLADMFGITVEDLYESYDMGEADLVDETVSQVNSYLLLSAISKAENIEVTPDDMVTFAKDTCEAYGYESADDMIAQSDEDELKLATLNRKVSYFLLGLANVTETEYDYSEEDLIFEDSSALDDWDVEYEDWDEDYEDYEDYDDEEWDDEEDGDYADIDWADEEG